MGNANQAVSGFSGRVRTAAANASAVAICEGTAVLHGSELVRPKVSKERENGERQSGSQRRLWPS